MAKRPPPPLDDALRAQLEAAREADRVADLTEPRARDVWYDPASRRIHVELKNGAAFAFPPSLYPELENLSAADTRPAPRVFGARHARVHPPPFRLR